MINWDKVEVVQKVQDYINKNIDEEYIDLDSLYESIGYSSRHANRIFKELAQKTILEYIRELRMAKSVDGLVKENNSILNIALDTNLKSHEGYTRAFIKKFGVTPSKYRKEEIPIPVFISYPIKHYYSYILNKELSKMSKNTEPLLCMITVVNRPKRKLMIMRAKRAYDYWSFCEEKGCQWEGLFNSIQCKLDKAAIIELPYMLVLEGTSKCAAGVELPIDYDGTIPKDCECIEVNNCDMMYFQSEPFDNDDDYGVAISSVMKAIEKYDYKKYGYEINTKLAPKFNYGASKGQGARIAVPVVTGT